PEDLRAVSSLGEPEMRLRSPLGRAPPSLPVPVPDSLRCMRCMRCLALLRDALLKGCGWLQRKEIPIRARAREEAGAGGIPSGLPCLPNETAPSELAPSAFSVHHG